MLKPKNDKQYYINIKNVTEKNLFREEQFYKKYDTNIYNWSTNLSYLKNNKQNKENVISNQKSYIALNLSKFNAKMSEANRIRSINYDKYLALLEEANEYKRKSNDSQYRLNSLNSEYLIILNDIRNIEFKIKFEESLKRSSRDKILKLKKEIDNYIYIINKYENK